MKNETGIRITQKDYKFAIAAGILIGFLFMPVLMAANPALYYKFNLAIVPFFLFASPLGLRIAFLIGKKIPHIYQLAKFILIGGLNTLVDLGILSFLSFAFYSYYNLESKDIFLYGITFYSVYKSISFIIANINSYYWNKYWTFNQGGQQKTKAEFVQFFVVSIIGFLINVFVASIVFKKILVAATGMTPDQLGLIGAAAGAVAGLAWNFIGYKLWVFKK